MEGSFSVVADCCKKLITNYSLCNLFSTSTLFAHFSILFVMIFWLVFLSSPLGSPTFEHPQTQILQVFSLFGKLSASFSAEKILDLSKELCLLYIVSFQLGDLYLQLQYTIILKVIQQHFLHFLV